MAGQGEAGLGEDSLSWWRYANLRLWHGMMVQGFAGQGSARRGSAWRGEVWQGLFELVAVPRIVEAWCGTAGHGTAGHGRDSFKELVAFANLRLWHGRAVQGFAGQGSARHGKDSLSWWRSRITKVWLGDTRCGVFG